MMQEKQRVPRVKHRDESRLLRAAIQVVHSDFPNPDRLGCPGRDALKAIERHRLSFPEAEDIVDHIATCAACFDEYTSNRRRHRLRVVRAVLACSVSLVLAIAVWWRVNPALFSVRKPPAVRSANPTLTVTLDLRNRTVERSGQSHLPEGVEIPHLRRGLLALTITLPMGVEDGVYSVQVRDRLDQAVADAVGVAKWDGSAEILTTTVNLSGLRGGDYLLAIGSKSSSWRKYPVRLE
jgi:hypothetical protein